MVRFRTKYGWVLSYQARRSDVATRGLWKGIGNKSVVLLAKETLTLDKLVREDLHNCLSDTKDVGELNFLLDEGLDLLSSYARIVDEDTRRALLRLVESMAKAER